MSNYICCDFIPRTAAYKPTPKPLTKFISPGLISGSLQYNIILLCFNLQRLVKAKDYKQSLFLLVHRARSKIKQERTKFNGCVKSIWGSHF